MLVDNAFPDEWLSVNDAYTVFYKQFRTKGALQYHLSRRSENGLEARDAVRKGPVGLIVNPSRMRAWLVAEGENAA